jgi:succinyl-CoA synthetase beta subunit
VRLLTDAVSLQKGKPAAFLDVGGGVGEVAMAETLTLTIVRRMSKEK